MARRKAMSKPALKRLENKRGMSWALKSSIMRKQGWTQGKGHHWVRNSAKRGKRK